MPRKDGGENAKERYDRTHTKGYCLKLNVNTDADLIEYIATLDNFQRTVKDLLREKMKRDC